MPIDVPVSSEDLTWSLTFVDVAISGEDSLSHQSTLVLYFSSPLDRSPLDHDAFEKAGICHGHENNHVKI